MSLHLIQVGDTMSPTEISSKQEKTREVESVTKRNQLKQRIYIPQRYRFN